MLMLDAAFDDHRNGVDLYPAGYRDEVDRIVEELYHSLNSGVYRAGDRLTLADVRVFPTLIRFDEVCHTHFKCNVRRIEEYEHLWPYLHDLHQPSRFAETVDIDQIKRGYLSGWADVDEAIVPVGPDFEAPHDRDRLPGGPPTAPSVRHVE